MYCAYVTRIHNLRKHTNADRLLCGECFGNGKFKFPSPIPLKKALVDMLEDKVDERYYLSDDKVAAMITPPVQTNQ